MFVTVSLGVLVGVSVGVGVFVTVSLGVFVVVTDFMMRLKMGKRIHLCEYETNELADALNMLLERKVAIPRMKVGARQSVETLINEEALIFAKYLRDERETWSPRVGSLDFGRTRIL